MITKDEASQGLSPLARGNLLGPGCRWRQVGPLPARAGEPYRVKKYANQLAAYPRSRGGTCSTPSPPKEFGGLSPLARGNLDGPDGRFGILGPIPARAGEPA